MNHTVLDRGNLKKSTSLEDSHLSFPSSADFFALPSNLISGLSGVSGGRVLLGSKASLQAVSLVNREAPLVQSYAGGKGDNTFVHTFGNELFTVKAAKPGVVVSHTNDEIVLKYDGESTNTTLQLYNHFNMGRKTFIHHQCIVKEGDRVKAGQTLANSNYTDGKGQLALGVNLKTAVMPYRSGNFEDAWVITEAGAKKLEAEQIFKYRLEKRFGVEAGKSKYVSLFSNKFTNQQLSCIDEDGCVKVGTKLHHGDPVILAYSPKALKSMDVQLGKLSKVLKNAYRDDTETWHYEHDGEVVDVSKTPELLTVQVKTTRGLSVGDKVSNVFGAKGVCGSIIPNSLAPTDKDGVPVDIMLNSMSITSRVAPALAVSLGMGKLAQKLGRPVKMAHFTEGSSVQKAIDSLKKHGIDDVEELYDPVTGRNINVMVGPMYFTRLVHIAEDKQSSRSQGMGYSWNMQPAKSDEESSKRVGNLATNALLAHNATAVLRDIATVKGTRNDEFWRRLKLGQPAPMPTVPFIFEKFIASMRGAGIKVDQRGSKFNLLPMVDKDVTAMSKGAIDSPLMFKTKKDQLVAEEGGLFDPVKVGILGNQYNHVDLNFPVPNPISEDYLRKLLGTTKVQFEQLMTSNQLTGKLAAINVTTKIEEYRKYLRSGKKTNRDNAVKVLGFLLMLQKNNIQPKDLMLSKIPVIPAQFRPTINQGDMSLTADINNLYKDLILTNNTLKGNQDDLPAELVEKLRKQQYEAVKAVYGLGDPVSTKNKEKGIKGLLATSLGIKGGSAKMAMFQSNVVNKPLDLVGRAVLTPDAKLDLDEASVPQDIIWKTYLPFIIRRLVLQGVPATKAAEYVKLRNPIARAAMMAELPHRPAIISRDPSLHKFNLTGFFLKPNPDNKDKTVKLNPLVFKSFNADNDGDQLNINVPAGEEARLEVLHKMLPSKILLSPKNFAPVYTPSNEAALGLYQASTENDHNPPKKFPTEQAVIEAFQKGLIGPGEVVDIG